MRRSRRVRLSEYWIAVRVFVFLCSLPFRLRRLSLPQLIERAGSRPPRWPSIGMPEPERIVSVVNRVCRLPVFRLSIFPRDCLRLALSLYHVLTPTDRNVCLRIGVRKENGRLVAHSWVTRLYDPTVVPAASPGFRIVYTHQPAGTLTPARSTT